MMEEIASVDEWVAMPQLRWRKTGGGLIPGPGGTVVGEVVGRRELEQLWQWRSDRSRQEWRKVPDAE